MAKATSDDKRAVSIDAAIAELERCRAVAWLLGQLSAGHLSWLDGNDSGPGDQKLRELLTELAWKALDEATEGGLTALGEKPFAPESGWPALRLSVPDEQRGGA